jgi:hypothetical protein
MKLSYLQSTDSPFDPLPKLGAKRHTRQPTEAEMAKCIREVAQENFSFIPGRIDDLDAALSTAFASLRPTPVDLDLSKPESWPVVSFADAAEMAEARAVLWADVLAAVEVAEARVGMSAWDVMLKHRTSAGAELGEFSNPQYSAHWPGLVAALEALQ